MTLKDLSEKTNLSIGFLSQLERGLTSIATDTLGSIADVFEVELSYFF
ncbi:helix-turn-helix transcriptional regulator [Paraclostridium bifermentans]|nr:helix-turn-helix transcriptional regulator [Paraclostridium bifermentans]